MAAIMLLGPKRLAGKPARITRWTLGILLGAFFLFAAYPKLMGLQFEREMFQNWGYPIWFMYVVGAAEFLFAVLVFLPQTRFWGAAFICGEMVGAALTHIQAAEYMMLPLPGVTFLGAFWLAWLERPALEQFRGPTERPAHA